VACSRQDIQPGSPHLLGGVLRCGATAYAGYLNYGASPTILWSMTDINSEIERLRNAPELDKAGIFESICKNYSSRSIVKAAFPTAKATSKRKSPAKKGVDRGGQPFSDR
jgi:hypothetical protein